MDDDHIAQWRVRPFVRALRTLNDQSEHPGGTADPYGLRPSFDEVTAPGSLEERQLLRSRKREKRGERKILGGRLNFRKAASPVIVPERAKQLAN